MKLVTIIDTDICNITSVVNTFERIGCDIKISNSKEDILSAEILVLPGVGSYEHGMSALKKFDLIDAIRDRVIKDKIPILGICLGMQLLAESSAEHGNHIGLGIIPGKVAKLESTDPGYRVPNMGWCDVIPDKESIMFPANVENETYYHVHSYYFECASASDVAAHISFNGKDIPVAVEKENVIGMQFHPEKSQDKGLNLLTRIIRNF